MAIMQLITKGITGLKQLVKGGFFYILTGGVLNKAIAMISSIVIAKLVDKAAYAELAYADNIYSYIALISGLGMSQALLKFCCTDDNTSLHRAYIRYACTLGGTFELIACIVACIVLSVLDIPYPKARTFAWVLVLYPLLTYIITTNSIYMRTQLENKRYAITGVLQSASVCLFSVGLIPLVGISGVISARYLAAILALIYGLIYIFPKLKGSKKMILPKDVKKAFFGMGFSLMLANFFSGIVPINEAFLVNNLIRDLNTTANFKVAGIFPQFLILISGAVMVYFFPMVAKLTDKNQIKKKVISIALVNFGVIVFATLVGILCTPLAIRICYGEKYLDAISISRILWIMRGMNCAVRMVPINMLPAIGKTKFNMVSSIISCIAQCLLDTYFLKNYGVVGVAYGATIVYFLSGVAYWIYFFYCCKERKHKN